MAAFGKNETYGFHLRTELHVKDSRVFTHSQSAVPNIIYILSVIFSRFFLLRAASLEVYSYLGANKRGAKTQACSSIAGAVLAFP